jgi:hypothetical protein
MEVSAARPSATGVKKSAAATSDPAKNLLRVGKVFILLVVSSTPQHILTGAPQTIAEKFPQAGHWTSRAAM